jgi:FkbM family methyltransferase
MSHILRQFLNTILQIYHSESVNMVSGLYRHFHWQLRKILRTFPVELALSHSRVVLDRPCGVGALINSMGMYDYNNMSLVRFVLAHSGGVFFDIGANIGSYTLIAAEQANAIVVSFEPHPISFRLLQFNVNLNSRTNVRLYNIALSNEQLLAFLTDVPELSVNRLTGISNGTELVVQCDTLDHFCEDQQIIPKLVKIDVEGHEVSVLEGFRRHVDSVDALMVENGDSAGVLSFLKGRGFHGPFYVHFKKRTLTPHPQARAEDQIYISNRFGEELSNIGFTVTAQ